MGGSRWRGRGEEERRRKRRKEKGEGSVSSGEKYVICRGDVREEEDEERKVKREEEKLGFDLHQFFQPAAPIFSD